MTSPQPMWPASHSSAGVGMSDSGRPNWSGEVGDSGNGAPPPTGAALRRMVEGDCKGQSHCRCLFTGGRLGLGGLPGRALLVCLREVHQRVPYSLSLSIIVAFAKFVNLPGSMALCQFRQGHSSRTCGYGAGSDVASTLKERQRNGGGSIPSLRNTDRTVPVLRSLDPQSGIVALLTRCISPCGMSLHSGEPYSIRWKLDSLLIPYTSTGKNASVTPPFQILFEL